MIAAAWLFLKSISPRTWLVIGLSIALVAGAVHFYRAGIEHERVVARAEMLEQGKTEAQKERDAFAARMSEAQSLASRAIAAEAAASARIVALDRQLSDARAREQQAAQQVAHVPDTGLAADIRGRLALHPGDPAPAFYPDELRAIDVNLAQAPAISEQLKTLEGQVAALNDRGKAQAQQIEACRQQTAALMQYAGELHRHYAEAYNAAQPHVSLFVKIITLGLKRERKLTLPPPDSLPVPAAPAIGDKTQ